MNILSISSILSIPEVIKHNDFVFQIYKPYTLLFPSDTVCIIKPVKYDFNIKRNLKRTSRLHKLKNNFSLKIDGFNVEIFPFLSTWRYRNLHSILAHSIYLFNLKRIKRLVEGQNFDVIHAQYIFPDGLLAYYLHKRYKIPYFVTTHNERYYFDHFLSRRSAVEILKNSNAVLPLNHSNFQYFKRIGIHNIDLSPLGFNKSFFRVQKTKNTNCVQLLTVAQLLKLKNIDKVLQALKHIVAEFDVSYTIIGSGPEKNALKMLTSSLGLYDHVIFLDHIPHEMMAEEMYKYDIFIMPSYFETFGRVYFEAMAMGIPIICAKNSGIYGLFREMEEGISVNHQDITEIVTVLRFLIKKHDERLRIGRNGQNMVKSYTWENIAATLHSKYVHAVRNS